MSDHERRGGAQTPPPPSVREDDNATPSSQNPPASRRFGPVVVVILLGLILTNQLLIPPVIGLADQGDFGRVFQRVGIDSDVADYNHRYFAYFIRTWKIDTRKAIANGFFSPDVLLVRASLVINPLLAKKGDYDIRSLALVRMAIFLIAALLLLQVAWRRGPLVRSVVVFALLVVFADVGYIAYFNSAYSEASSFLFGLLAITFYLRLAASEGRPLANFIAFVGSSVLLIWSKPQNVLLGVPLFLVTLRLMAVDRSRRWRTTVALGALVLLGTAALVKALPPPRWYRDSIRYIAVFKALLPSSPTPFADLEELGVDPGLATLSGTYGWSKEAVARANEVKAGFLDRISDSAIARFYMRHPLRTWPLLELAAAHSLYVRSGLGNYEESTGFPPFSHARSFSLRSTFMNRFGPSHLGWIFAWLGLALSVATLSWLRARIVSTRLASEAVAFLVAGAVIQYCMVAVLQGHAAEEQGMFLFAFFFDTTIVATLALGAGYADALLKKWREAHRGCAAGSGPGPRILC